ncbi:hypothetical protein JCM10450v2_002054 [Rhodotorula kratochvilovae]
MFHLADSPSLGYASSISSTDDHPSPSFRRGSSDSSSSSSASTHSTAPSSLASSPCTLASAHEWNALEHSTGAFVHGLLKQRREAEIALQAWRVRCETLEAEVGRLALLLDRAEKERDEARREGREGRKGMVEETVQTDLHSDPSRSPSRACPAGSGPRPVINPDLPMSKQAVPPCNAQYLKGYCDVPRCRYEHRYELTHEQVEEMRRGAKHHVCNAIKHGLPCPDGEDCIFGHFCPRGPSCGRERCGFNDEQHLVAPLPRPLLRRR